FLAPYGMFQARDGEFYMGVGSDRMFADLCAAIGREDLSTDARFATNDGRVERRDELHTELARTFAEREAQGWVDVCSGLGIPAGADCGLERRQPDGLIVHIGSPRGLDHDELALLLGLDVRFAAQTWSHGRFTATVLLTAALALDAGLADYTLCVAAFKNTAF